MDKFLIPNVNIETIEIDGAVASYLIRPMEGYKLHSKEFDMPVFDEKTDEETNQIKLGYTVKGFTTVFPDYDWKTNPRQIYAVPIDKEEEIITVEDTDEMLLAELVEKAGAYDILTGVEE